MAHVLECHPWNPRLAFSAGYDGQLIIWDVDQGQVLRR
jgi:PH-interacting protein